ncbi:peptidoglycan DD-metalloendopeptidase family protein [Priestia filamentosa]|uniref:murein hydrolase activator EnvC family protein n=1 Tax=Priestia filamentosa TaxID=1402861 RepID=UPI0039822143
MNKKLLIISCASLLATINSTHLLAAEEEQVESSNQQEQVSNEQNEINHIVDTEQSPSNNNSKENSQGKTEQKSQEEQQKQEQEKKQKERDEEKKQLEEEKQEQLLEEAERQKEVNHLKTDLEQAEDNKTNIKNQISEVEQYIDDAEKKVMEIQKQVADTEQKIKEREEKINNLTSSIFNTQNQIIKKQKEIDDQKKKLGQTIAFMYENKDFGFFQFFFQTKNLGDSLKAYELISLIADENDRLYQSILLQQQKLKEQKEKQEKNKSILEQSRQSLNELKQNQETQKAEQTQVLNQHKERELKMHQKLAEEEAATQEIMKKIDAAMQKSSTNQGTKDIPLTPNQMLTSPLKAGTYTISSLYGSRYHPVLGTTRFHNGIDMAAPFGTSIFSASTGTVLFAGKSSGYGNWIVIQGDNGLTSIYGHMETGNLYVSPGERVSQGQFIAKVGSAGISTGPHLHFSVSTNYNKATGTFNYIDPLTVLK